MESQICMDEWMEFVEEDTEAGQTGLSSLRLVTQSGKLGVLCVCMAVRLVVEARGSAMY